MRDFIALVGFVFLSMMPFILIWVVIWIPWIPHFRRKRICKTYLRRMYGIPGRHRFFVEPRAPYVKFLEGGYPS